MDRGKQDAPARRYRGYRRTVEEVEGFVWEEANRKRHYRKHGIDFPIVSRVDWARVLKRKDTAHSGAPPRWNARVRVRGLDIVLFIV